MALTSSFPITLTAIQNETSTNSLDAAGIAAGFTASGTAMSEFLGYSHNVLLFEYGGSLVYDAAERQDMNGNNMNNASDLSSFDYLKIAIQDTNSITYGNVWVQFDLGPYTLDEFAHVAITWELGADPSVFTDFQEADVFVDQASDSWDSFTYDEQSDINFAEYVMKYDTIPYGSTTTDTFSFSFSSNSTLIIGVQSTDQIDQFTDVSILIHRIELVR